MRDKDSKYITYKEIKQKYGLTEHHLRECYKEREKNKYIYFENDVKKIFDERQKKIKEVENLIDSGEWIQFSKIEDNQIRGKITRAFKRNRKLKEDNQIIIESLGGNRKFVRKTFITEVNEKGFLESQIYEEIETLTRKKYILASKVKKKYGLTNYQLKDCNKEKYGKENLYLESDVKRIFNERKKNFEAIERLKNSDEWIQFSEIEDNQIRGKITRAFKRNNKLKDENQIKVKVGEGTRIFIRKIFINEVKKENFWELQKYKRVENQSNRKYLLARDIKKKYGLTKNQLGDCYKEKHGKENFYLESDVKRIFNERKKKFEAIEKLKNSDEWIQFSEIDDKEIQKRIRYIFKKNSKIKKENQVIIEGIKGKEKFVRKIFITEVNKESFLELLTHEKIDNLKNEKYILASEIRKKYGLTDYQFKNCPKKKYGSINLYLESDIKNIFNERQKKIKIVENLKNSGEWVQFSEIKNKRIQSRIVSVFKKNNKLKEENQIIIESIDRKKRFIRKMFIDEVNKENFWELQIHKKIGNLTNEEYILASEIKRKYGLEGHQYSNCRKKIIGRKYIYLENDVKKIVEDKKKKENELEKIKNSDEWILLSEIKDKRIIGKIRREFFKRKERKEKYGRVFSEKGKKLLFVKKMFIEEVKNEKPKIRHVELKTFDLLELGEILDKIKFTKKAFNRTIYEFKEIEKYIDANDREFKEVITREELEELMNKNKMYSLDKIGFAVGLSKKSMKTLLRRSSINFINIKDLIFFNENQMEKFVLFIINRRNYEEVRRIEDMSVLLDKRIELFGNDDPDLKNVIHTYLKIKINKDMAKRDANRVIDALEMLYINIEKKLELYTDEEIILFLKEGVSNKKIKKGHITIIAAFINNYRKVKDTLYKKEISERLINQKKEKRDKIYSEEIWRKYYFRLTDIKIHIEMAKENHRYAQMWLYCLENLFLPIRRMDLINKTENIFPEAIEVKTLNDIDEFISEEKIDIILEQIKIITENLRASKNDEEIMFIVPSSIKKVFVISYLICELHRRELKREKIFSSFSGNIEYKKELFGEEELYDFRNLRCTKSIISYGYNYGINFGENDYNIFSLQRSHKKEKGKLSNTVSEYYLINDKEVLDFVENLMQREAFGFIYYRIVGIILAHKDIDIKKFTQKIQFIKENVTVLQLEKFVEDLDNKENILDATRNEMSSIVGSIKMRYEDFDEFMTEVVKHIYKKNYNILFNKIEIDNKFIDIRIDKVKSIIDNKIKNNENFYSSFNDIFKEKHIMSEGVFCLYEKGEERNNRCIYIKNGGTLANCSMCECSMLTLVNLSQVSRNLKKIIKNIDKGNLDELLIKKYNHMIKIYLYILVEAYSFLGKERMKYFEYLVDFKHIKNDLIRLRKEGMLKNE